MLLFTEFSWCGRRHLRGRPQEDRRVAGGSSRRRRRRSTCRPTASGRWRIVPGRPRRLMIYPTGAGEPRAVDTAPLVRTEFARWFADGSRMAGLRQRSRQAVALLRQGCEPAAPARSRPTTRTSPTRRPMAARRADATRRRLTARVVSRRRRRAASRRRPRERRLHRPLGSRRTGGARQPHDAARAGGASRRAVRRADRRRARPRRQHANAGLRFGLTAIADDPRVYAYVTTHASVLAVHGPSRTVELASAHLARLVQHGHAQKR